MTRYLYPHNLKAKANIWLWVVGAIMPVVHGVLYLTKGVYADAAMQLYYVAAGVYGLVVWSSRPKHKSEGKIRHTPKGWILPLVAVYAVLHVAIYYILDYIGSSVSFFDSMSTALCIVAMWMLSRKLVEQWLVWLLVNGVTVIMTFNLKLYPTSVLYAVNAAASVYGYFHWKRNGKEI